MHDFTHQIHARVEWDKIEKREKEITKRKAKVVYKTITIYICRL